MTLPYTWNSMPHRVNVVCPNCRGNATFEFATTCKIERRKDIPFFEDHHSLDYFNSKDSCGHKFHIACYYPQLHGNNFESIGDLPEGYAQDSWKPSQYFSRSNTSWGSFLCTSCHHRSKGEINWPADAYYKIEYKSQVLWAFNRESLVTLIDYIGSTQRCTTNHGWKSFLMKVPTVFLKASARVKIVKELNKLILGN